ECEPAELPVDVSVRGQRTVRVRQTGRFARELCGYHRGVVLRHRVALAHLYILSAELVLRSAKPLHAALLHLEPRALVERHRIRVITVDVKCDAGWLVRGHAAQRLAEQRSTEAPAR